MTEREIEEAPEPQIPKTPLPKKTELKIFLSGVAPSLAYGIILFLLTTIAFPDYEDGEGWIGFFLGLPFAFLIVPTYIIIWRFTVPKFVDFKTASSSPSSYLFICIFFNYVIMFLAMGIIGYI